MRAVADAGGDADDRTADKATDGARKGGFHAGAADDNAGGPEFFALFEEAMEAGDADIGYGDDIVTHKFGGEAGFFGNREVGGAGADDEDLALADHFDFALEDEEAAERVVDGFGQFFLDGACGLFGDTGGEDVVALGGNAFGNSGNLRGSLALSENHFRHAMAEGTVVVYLGELDVLERHVLHLDGGGFGREFAGTDLFEEGENLFLIHIPKSLSLIRSGRRSRRHGRH